MRTSRRADWNNKPNAVSVSSLLTRDADRAPLQALALSSRVVALGRGVPGGSLPNILTKEADMFWRLLGNCRVLRDLGDFSFLLGIFGDRVKPQDVAVFCFFLSWAFLFFGGYPGSSSVPPGSARV